MPTHEHWLTPFVSLALGKSEEDQQSPRRWAARKRSVTYQKYGQGRCRRSRELFRVFREQGRACGSVSRVEARSLISGIKYNMRDSATATTQFRLLAAQPLFAGSRAGSRYATLLVRVLSHGVLVTAERLR